MSPDGSVSRDAVYRGDDSYGKKLYEQAKGECDAEVNADANRQTKIDDGNQAVNIHNIWKIAEDDVVIIAGHAFTGRDLLNLLSVKNEIKY